MAELASERTIWDNVGEVDTQTYMLGCSGLPTFRVYSPASALEVSTPPSLDEIHLLKYKLETALIYPRDSPWGSTEGVRLRVGDVVTAVGHVNSTAVVTSFLQDADSLLVRGVGDSSEFAPRGTPVCPAIFGRFSLHHALPAPVSSDTGAAL